MKAQTRYILVVLWLLLCFLLVYYRRFSCRLPNALDDAPSYITFNQLLNRNSRQSSIWPITTSECSMANCFDISRCLAQKSFRVYVYPVDNQSTISIVYTNILKVIRESFYYTADPAKACLFVLSIDTVDRDRRSGNYVKYVNELIAVLPSKVWNYGRNHIIFNHYHGTYPDYSDHDLGFDVGYAMIARASANAQIFRDGFDLSFPLFHKQHPLRTTVEAEWCINLMDRHLVSFKGKRYVYGIGSETRDSLYHLHNGQTVVMVTTCKHNTDWKKYEDGRCEEDNFEYERWDYDQTMSNSTFCLTPRGRRLGSFRFLEALRLGCIPVIMSDDWELPFSEIIDWHQAVVIGHEDTVLTISDILSSIPLHQILFMKQQTRGLYQRYFSSVDKVIRTSLQIVEERILKQRGKETRNWNSISLTEATPKANQSNTCTVLLRASVRNSGRLSRIVKLLVNMKNVLKVVILWPYSRGSHLHLYKFGQNVFVYESDFEVQYNSLNYTREIYKELFGEHVLLLDERVEISPDQILFMLDALEAEPERFYGFYSAYHEERENSLYIEVASARKYSLILPHFALIKKHHLLDYWQWLPNPALEISKSLPQCFTVLLNIMMTEVTMRPPVLVGSKQHEKWMLTGNYSTCMKKLIPNIWQSGPLLMSGQTKIDPLLYQEDIASSHKKYRNMEL